MLVAVDVATKEAAVKGLYSMEADPPVSAPHAGTPPEYLITSPLAQGAVAKTGEVPCQ